MNSNSNSNNSVEAVMAAPVAQPKKEKRPMSQVERERNERRKAAFAELRALNPKAKWTNASKLVSFRNKGKNTNANALLRNVRNSVNVAGVAAAAAATVANKPVAATVKKAKKEVAFAALKAANTAVTRNNKNRSRNAVKTNLTARMSVHGKKPSAILIQKLLGLRRAGKNNTEFLAEVDRVAAAAAAAEAAKVVRREERAAKKAAKTQKNAKKVNISPKVWKTLKAQVNENVRTAGVKVNAINRRALAHLRKNRPNLTVANFMRNRGPRVRRSRKVKGPNNNSLVKLFNNPNRRPRENIGNFVPQVNKYEQQRLNELLRNSERGPRENVGNFAPQVNKYEQKRLNELLRNSE